MDRDFILQEIKRTAAENGGAALGQIRFERETGITRHDTEKYWARWGDALLEAGYGPNAFTQATPDDVALAALADLTRKLGRFPTKREIMLNRFQGEDMPAYRVYERIGQGQAGLAWKLMEYCEANAGWDDVAELCRNRAAPPEPTLKPRGGVVALGEVYLIRSGRFFKIGYSVSAGRRLREFEIQLPETPKRVHTIRTDDPRGVEAYWHRRFEAKRVRPGAEFFKLDPNDVRAFCAWKRIV